MPFRDPIAAGLKLIRTALQSGNYLAGVSGWSINKDGTCEFNSGTFRGTVTASEFKSTDFVSGTSGFDLNGTTNPSTVQLNGKVNIGGAADLTIGGGAGQASIEIKPSAWAFTEAIINLAPNAGELAPAVLNAQSSGPSTPGYQVTIDSPQGGVLPNRSSSEILLYSGNGNDAGNPPAVQIDCGNPSSALGLFEVKSGTQAQLQNTGTTPATAPLLVGDPAGFQLVGHGFGLDAANNGTRNQPLYLNNNATTGIASVQMRAVQAQDQNTYTINQTTYFNPTNIGQLITLPPSGVLLVHLTTVVFDLGGAGSAQFGIGSIKIINNRTGGVLFNPNDAQGFQYKMTVAAGLSLTLSGTVIVTGLNTGSQPGDQLKVVPEFRTTVAADTFNVQKTTITAIPIM